MASRGTRAQEYALEPMTTPTRAHGTPPSAPWDTPSMLSARYGTLATRARCGLRAPPTCALMAGRALPRLRSLARGRARDGCTRAHSRPRASSAGRQSSTAGRATSVGHAGGGGLLYQLKKKAATAEVEEEEEAAVEAQEGDLICVVCPTHGDSKDVYGRRQWRCCKGGRGNQCVATMHCKLCDKGGNACFHSQCHPVKVS